MADEATPNGWMENPLGEIATVRRGITYTTEMLKSGDAGLPYVNMKSFLKGGGFNPSGMKRYAGSYSEEDLVGEHDLLIANTDVTAGDIVGVPALLPAELAQARVLYSHHVTRLRLSADIWVPFLYHLLSLPGYRSRMLGIARGTTVLMLDMQAIKQLPVRAPRSAGEQRRIAEILDTLDEAIRKTEQVIAKLQQMKQGLRHDLLTLGIDENGELRDPERHPEQFKDSPLGRIPRGWRVSALGELLDGVIDFRGRTPKKLGMSWGGGSIPALSAKNVRMGKIDLTLETYYGSPALYERWMTSGHACLGDVLLTMEAPLGNVAQIPDERRYILSQRVVLLKFDEQQVLNPFTALQMRHQAFQANLRRWSTGTTATGIQRAKLVLVPVVVPPLAEQTHTIASILAADARLSAEETTASKLHILKHGLMDDLLTGRVRVSVPEVAAA